MNISSRLKIIKLKKKLKEIKKYKSQIELLSDKDLKDKTNYFKEKIKDGETLDSLLCEAYAVVYETIRRVLKIEPYDVQLLGAILLHQGHIAEMKTGEGKTLVALFPAYLNSLIGNGVHIITTNDYLAKRDKENMGKVFEFLGLKVGVILSNMDINERKNAYNSDITYGTNKEFGFDYLRDNLAKDLKNVVQRKLEYAIIDEADSVLIDDAGLPLIISSTKNKINPIYYAKANQFVRRLNGIIVERIKNKRHQKKLEKFDYVFDLHTYSVYLTEKGVRKAEEDYCLENLYDPKCIKIIHYIQNALIAHTTMKKDVDYIVNDGKVFVVDQNIGRIAKGKQFNDGVQQAIEAKEYLENTNEGEILASITFQNYFKMYNKIAGMTGTIMTSRKEIEDIYHLDCYEVPTNKSIKRKDKRSKIFLSNVERDNAVLKEIIKTHKKSQPILIGTSSIKTSEDISNLLNKNKISHQILNAKNHEKEAEIIAKAGEENKVTISTNMAGRGTDIKLLSEQVKKIGGLKIIGTEMNNSKRIDNQLRGRSGRQGDVGESIFFISIEQENLKPYIKKSFFDNQITLRQKCQNAQREIEGKGISLRKSELKYDDIINIQRQIIYNRRRSALESETVIEEISKKAILKLLEIYKNRDNSIINKIEEELGKIDIEKNAYIKYEQNRKMFGKDFLDIRKDIVLKAIDNNWKEHINVMEDLKYGMPLRFYRKKDPYYEYIIESYNVFEELENKIVEDISMNLLFMTKVEK